MDKRDSKLTRITEEEDSLWKHILLHTFPEDLEAVIEAMYQLAEARYQYAVLKYDARRLLQT